MVRCSFCDNLMSETDLNCPFCGTPHDPIKRGPSGVPRTISELKKFVDTTGISLARLHFHIDEDYRGSRAFGIYRDPKTGNFVVYKNKDTGERAIRYEGPDEAHAVYEIYQKLKERMTMYRNNPMNRHTDLYKDPKPDLLNIGSTKTGIIIVVIVTVFMILLYMLSYSIGYIPNSGGGGSSSRYESSYDNDSDYSYSDWGSDSGSDYDDWSSDW